MNLSHVVQFFPLPRNVRAEHKALKELMCEFKVLEALGDLVAPVKAERLPPSVLLNVTA